MVDLQEYNTAFPLPISGEEWYQSFTATQSSKLKKFAFGKNGGLDDISVTVIIREGEGIDDTTNRNIYQGIWTNMGTDTAWTEYVITSDVNLINNQKYSIQLIGTNNTGQLLGNDNDSLYKYDDGQFYFPSYFGNMAGDADLIMQIWVEPEPEPVI
jgi:hypothetical protein